MNYSLIDSRNFLSSSLISDICLSILDKSTGRRRSIGSLRFRIFSKTFSNNSLLDLLRCFESTSTPILSVFIMENTFPTSQNVMLPFPILISAEKHLFSIGYTCPTSCVVLSAQSLSLISASECCSSFLIRSFSKRVFLLSSTKAKVTNANIAVAKAIRISANPVTSICLVLNKCASWNTTNRDPPAMIMANIQSIQLILLFTLPLYHMSLFEGRTT